MGSCSFHWFSLLSVSPCAVPFHPPHISTLQALHHLWSMCQWHALHAALPPANQWMVWHWIQVRKAPIWTIKPIRQSISYNCHYSSLYSFVAGSDGNLYEGRGWNWVGAHTYGYNSKGYGVSFIGDYTSTLPIKSAMDMVRYDFTSCAVNGGGLSSSYSLYGHRQATSTDCPGNSFYREIQTWEHYQVKR